MDKFLKECFLQKTNQFNALKLLHGKDSVLTFQISGEHDYVLKLLHGKDPVLTLGTELVLGFEDVTKSGKKSIVAKYGDDIIGILSEEDSKDIKPYFEAGWTDNLFSCRISRYNADADENKRFSIAIYIKKGANAE